jgi:hypothetical protein
MRKTSNIQCDLHESLEQWQTAIQPPATLSGECQGQFVRRPL